MAFRFKLVVSPVPKDTQLCILIGLFAVTVLLATLVTMPDGEGLDTQLLTFMPTLGSSPSLHMQLKLAMALCAMAILLMLLHIVTIQWRTSQPLQALTTEMQRISSAEPIPAGARVSPPADFSLREVAGAFNKLLEHIGQQQTTIQQRTSDMNDFRQEFASVFEASTLPMCMLASDGAIIQANVALCRLVGCAEEALLQRQWTEVISVDDLSPESLLVRVFELHGGLSTADGKVKAASGRQIACEISTSVQRDAHDAPRYAMVYINSTQITRQLKQTVQQMQQQLDVAATIKDRFIAAASFELRAPLTPALMLVNAMEREAHLPEECRDDLSMIREYLETEKNLIDALLDVSAARDGQLQIQLANISVHDCMKNACLSVDGELRRRDITMEHDFVASGDTLVGDSKRLVDAFGAILRSAAAAGGDDATVQILTRNSASNSVNVEISVDITALSSSELARLLEPLAAGEALLSSHGGRTSLELAMARAVIEAHDGAIVARGDGQRHALTFVIVLPVRGTYGVQCTPEGIAMAPLGRSLHLLVIDDDVLTLEAYTRVLLDHGHVVSAAKDAAGALHLAQHRSFDLAISDVGLPDMSGTELMPLLRDRFGVRGIAVTGANSENDRRAISAAGFERCFVKPIRMTSLVDAIQTICAAPELPQSPGRMIQSISDELVRDELSVGDDKE